ncbi:hypothetical protein [Fonticella tunisiensis]|uniref:hypothetical protein n=1 Tax=Fonticella tunisiensis TaxID=1096341 RepID=UPI00105E9536|nr:hypothetical protein [Fonticella tunisiensis]
MAIVELKGLSQISSSDELMKVIKDVISSNLQSVNDFKSGKTQAAGFLMGQVMKVTRGKANPKLAKELLDDLLNNL